MTTFFVMTVLFIVVSVTMILIILVQRSQGGGLAGAFGGAGGGSTDTVFGGRVGDALTWATVVAFVLYLSIAVLLNRVSLSGAAPAQPGAAVVAPETTPLPTGAPASPGTGTELPPPPATSDGP